MKKSISEITDIFRAKRNFLSPEYRYYNTSDEERINRTWKISFNSWQIKELQKHLEAYREMYEITKPACALSCKTFRCCEPSTCEVTKEEMAERNITFPETGHKKGCYNSNDGCVLPPYLRPMCSNYLCGKASRENKKVYTDFDKIKDSKLGKSQLKLEWQWGIDPTVAIYRLLADGVLK
ncbi:MAG: hypothetical protein H7235_07940 [Bdellovibrionaceae bacterium]|nr:hypothetical protein [Pseudobdellovibrionaceae bacterium]